MIVVSKGVLKAKMLMYFRQVEKTKEELIVTDHHKPVLRITPVQEYKLPTDVFKKQGRVVYFEDINTPTSNEWGENN
jgi:antitoxin (DNA-binding transcriptional repressor) of toxin-antitoxin stability system